MSKYPKPPLNTWFQAGEFWKSSANRDITATDAAQLGGRYLRARDYGVRFVINPKYDKSNNPEGSIILVKNQIIRTVYALNGTLHCVAIVNPKLDKTKMYTHDEFFSLQDSGDAVVFGMDPRAVFQGAFDLYLTDDLPIFAENYSRA